MSALIEFRQVCKTYQMGDTTVRAADHISMRIEKGEFVAIVGQSGSGKSTCMNIIGCLDVPTSGTYLLDGRDVGQMDTNQLAAIRNELLGFIFQQYNLLPKLDLLENVEVPLMYAGVPKAERRQRAREVLEQVGLGDKLHHLPNQLSGGQQQRVALARMMIGEPEAILLDEPFSALDGYLKDTLQKDMEDFLKQYQGDMIMVTHSRDEAFRFCKELMLLKDGRTLTFGDTRHLFEQPGLLEVARLTGCKNNSRARKLGAYEIEALDWGLKLHTTQEVPDDITHVAIRGHWMQPADTPGQNTVPFEVQDYIETTFEHQYLVKCPNADTDAVLWWMRPKPNFQLDPRANLPKYLYLPPEHLMLLKP